MNRAPSTSRLVPSAASTVRSTRARSKLSAMVPAIAPTKKLGAK